MMFIIFRRFLVVNFLTFSAFSLIGCADKPNVETVEVIDIERSQRVYMSKLVESIEYVVLEHPSRSFAQADKLFVTEGGYILADFWNSNTFLRYDKTGSFLNPIGKRGEGPGEYWDIVDVDYDERNDQLILLTPKGIMSYTVDGDFAGDIGLGVRPYKFIILDGNKFLFYVPQVSTFKLREGFGKSILYHYSPENKNLEPILDPIFPDVLNFTGEKNNIFKFGNTVFFSSNACDTIYFISEKKLRKKMFLDFGSEQNDLTKLYGLSGYEIVERLQRDEYKNTAIHVPHLFGNNRYLSSAFRRKGGFDFFVYDMQEKVTYLSSKMVNDLDGGMGFGIIKRMDEDYLYSFFEPEEILQHYGKNIDKLKDLDKNFSKLAKRISKDDFLILAKFKLKR